MPAQATGWILSQGFLVETEDHRALSHRAASFQYVQFLQHGRLTFCVFVLVLCWYNGLSIHGAIVSEGPPHRWELSMSRSGSFVSAMLACVAMALLGSSAGAETYSCVDLGPVGLVVSQAQGISSDGSQQVGTGFASHDDPYGNHALLWSGSAQSVVDLQPSGFLTSDAYGANGGEQVGIGYLGRFSSHALLWHGSADSYIDLHPSGYLTSGAWATNGKQQVGRAVPPGIYGVTGGHAILWNGSAEDYVDLNPPGFRESSARALTDTQQVGYGGKEEMSDFHALLWSGTPGSYVDLNPDWLEGSSAWAVCGDQQVGSGGLAVSPDDDIVPQAILWTGTAQSAVNLNPAGFVASSASGTNGIVQVGSGAIHGLDGSANHALLWHGSAESYVDLNEFLPAGFTESEAYAVDAAGRIVGTCSNSSCAHAVMWVPVPEPSCMALLMAPAILLCRKARLPF